MKPLLFLAAEYANVTNDGKLNVMGVFNDIFSYNFPTRSLSLHLVGKLGADPGEDNLLCNFTIQLLDENGHQIMDISGPIEIQKSDKGRKPEVNLILELKDIVFPRPGVYQFVLSIEKDLKCELNIYVNQIEAPNWKRTDLKSLYEGFGFTIRHGGSHDTVKHPDFPQLRATLPSHPQLAKRHVQFAVQLVDRLLELEKENRSNYEYTRAS